MTRIFAAVATERPLRVPTSGAGITEGPHARPLSPPTLMWLNGDGPDQEEAT